MFVNRPAMKKEFDFQASTTNGQDDESEPIEAEVYFIRDSIQKRLLADSNGEVSGENEAKLRQTIENMFNDFIVEQNLLYSRPTRNRMLEWVIADIMGYGPLDPLLKDTDITEIMVNGYENIFIERLGLIEHTNVKFGDEAHLRRIIDRIVAPIGRHVDESSPMVDARLPNGFRVNATIPPLSLSGPL